MTISNYHNSPLKRLLDIFLSAVIIFLTSPLIMAIAVINKLTSVGPVFFIQKREGKNSRVFKIIKFRTMIDEADKIQKKYIKLNESDGPVFKIRNDPRFTVFGKVLSNTGLDELPQFINVIKGDMSIVGPRPLPVGEAKRLPKAYKIRNLVKPGITSSWVVGGSHNLPFKKWMSLDRKYVISGTFKDDLEIMFKTSKLMVDFLTKSLNS